MKVEVGEAIISGNEASVMFELFWGGNPTPSERVVSLELVDGQWMIAGVGIAE